MAIDFPRLCKKIYQRISEKWGFFIKCWFVTKVYRTISSAVAQPVLLSRPNVAPRAKYLSHARWVWQDCIHPSIATAPAQGVLGSAVGIANGYKRELNKLVFKHKPHVFMGTQGLITETARPKYGSNMG
jgi:hypothetical protein